MRASVRPPLAVSESNRAEIFPLAEPSEAETTETREAKLAINTAAMRSPRLRLVRLWRRLGLTGKGQEARKSVFCIYPLFFANFLCAFFPGIDLWSAMDLRVSFESVLSYRPS